MEESKNHPTGKSAPKLRSTGKRLEFRTPLTESTDKFSTAQSLAKQMAEFAKPLDIASLGFSKALLKQQKEYQNALAPLKGAANLLAKAANPPLPKFDIPTISTPKFDFPDLTKPRIVEAESRLPDLMASIDAANEAKWERQAKMDQVKVDTLDALETLRDFSVKESEYRVEYDTKQAEYNRNRDGVSKKRHQEAMTVGRWTLCVALGGILVTAGLAIFLRPAPPIVNVDLRPLESKIDRLIKVNEANGKENTLLRKENRKLKSALQKTLKKGGS